MGQVVGALYPFWILAYILNCHSVVCFNIDTKNPVIVTDSFDGPTGYFGTTVLLVNGRSTGVSSKTSRVIVGAPKANSRKLTNVKEPGIVWRCSLGKTNGDSCEVLEMDNYGNEMQSHHAPGGDVYHLKDGGFFGSSLSINSDRFLACAPRWANQRANNISQTSHYLMNGLCYWRPTGQLHEDFLPDPPTNHTLIPLRNKDRQGFRGKQGFDWTFGQAGFSAHVTDEGESILGAPGVYDWRGTVIQLKDSISPRLRRNGLAEDFGTFFQAKQLVMQSQLETLWKQNATYFGYAVNSGRFVEASSPSVQYVASAPRGGFQHNLSGHVLVFTFPETDAEPLNILTKIDGPAETAAYFGSVICAVDLNNDGWTDLLIGAPLFNFNSEKSARILDASSDDSGSSSADSPLDPESNFAGHGDEGAVFLYMSERDKIVPRGFIGNNEAWARFGSSIAAIGDINKDGYNDVAIGAPYEDTKRGAVYIYHGSQLGLTRKYVQVIRAKELDPLLRGFGFSLSPGIDVDGNGYNDLAVGAYLSGQLVILRTNPVIRIIGSLTSTVNKIPINTKDFTFNVSSCVGFESKDAISPIALSVTLYSDVNSIVTRVYLTDDTMTPTTQIDYTVEVRQGNQDCRNYTGITKQRLTLSGQRVLLRQEVSLIDRRKLKQGKTDYTILPLGPGATIARTQHNGTAFNSFCKYCPVTEVNVTKADLQLDPSVLCGDDDICIADLQVDAEFSNFTDGEAFVIGSAPKIHLVIELRNDGETAIYPKLIISWLRLSLVTMPSDCDQQTVRNSFNLSCSLGQTLEKGQKRKLDLEFDVSDLMAGEQNELKEFVLNIEPTTTSNLLHPGQIYPLFLPLQAKASIDMFATLTLLNITTVNPYNVFTHSYLIKLNGPSTLKTTELEFDIPESILGSPRNNVVINVTHIEAKQNGDEIICNGPDSLSELFRAHDPDLDGIEDQYSQPKPRQRRSTNSKQEQAGLVKENTLMLNCNAGQLECVKVICLVHKFIPGTRVNVDITFRMERSKAFELLETFGVQNIEYKTRGKVTIVNVDISVPAQEAITRLGIIVITSNVLRWVVASVAAGFFIIFCIGILLCCCGVFDRKKIPEEELEAELEATPLQDLRPPELIIGNAAEDSEEEVYPLT